MNPKALRALAEIVDLGSFSRAAEALNVTQPTLSQAIKQLEAAVGASVLRRGRYGISPTRIGELLAREGRVIGTALRHAETSLKQWRGGIEAHLKVGVGPMIAQTIMPAFVASVLADNWNIGMKVYTEGAHRIVAGVKSGDLDLALAPVVTHHAGDDLIREPLFEDDVGIYAGARHTLAKKRRLVATDLEDQHWVGVGAMLGSRDVTISVIECLGVRTPSTVVDFSGDVAMPLRLVASGKYLALFPNFLMRHLPERRQFVRLPLDFAQERRDIALWYRMDLEAHPSIMSFRDRFRSFLADLAHAEKMRTGFHRRNRQSSSEAGEHG